MLVKGQLLCCGSYKIIAVFAAGVDILASVTDNRVMKKIIFLVVLLLISSVTLAACGKEDAIVQYYTYVDTSREYTEQTLTQQQMQAYSYANIQNYYTSGEYRVFRVVAKFGYKGEVQLALLLNGTTVEKIAGIDVQETINYGAKCFKDNYLKQFYGIDLAEIQEIRGKARPRDEGEIVYVTGATVTSRAVIDAVNAVAKFINAED